MAPLSERPTFNILISGVGGQGVVLASYVLSRVALAEGYDVKQSEVHGMAQRGGCVTSHLRFGDKVYAALITPGTVVEPSLLPENKASYLLAILPVGDPASGQWEAAGIAYADLSTGEFAATQLDGESAAIHVVEELARLAPREVRREIAASQISASSPRT